MKPIERLRQQYNKYKTFESVKNDYPNIFKKHYNDYKVMCLFGLDCSLVSFTEIKLMEYEENNKI